MLKFGAFTAKLRNPPILKAHGKSPVERVVLYKLELITLFKNEHFVAVDKPHGVLTTPSRMGANETRPCLGTTLQESLKTQIYPVHRLDFEVSGLVLFALTPQAHKAANLWWESRFVTKNYEALTHDLVEGSPPRQWQTWQSKLLRGKRRAYQSSIGKEAITMAQFVGFVRERPNKIARWNLRPLTGRAHQLRFELAHHGYPILGDILYGASDPKLKSRSDQISLRAVSIDFRGLSDRTTWGLPEELKASSLSLIE